MLLLVSLTLKGRITVSQPTPVPIPIPIKTPLVGSSENTARYYNNLQEQIIRIEIDNSEIIAIVELTLRNFII